MILAWTDIHQRTVGILRLNHPSQQQIAFPALGVPFMPSRRLIVRHAIVCIAFVLVYLLLNRPEVIFLSRIGFVTWYPAIGLVSCSESCKKSVQLTGLLKNNQVEKAYLLTKIKNPEYQRRKLAEKIIDAEYTVKQTKQIVSKVKDENESPSEAIELIKNQPVLPVIKIERKTVPVEEFNRLQADYERILKEKQELEIKFKIYQNLKNR